MEEIENYIPEEEYPVKKEVKKIDSFTVIVVILLSIILFILIFSLISYFTSINRPKEKNENIKPTITIIKPSPTLVIKPSSWATDSAILKLEEKINSQGESLNSIDLNETVLTFPSLDFNINFEKK